MKALVRTVLIDRPNLYDLYVEEFEEYAASLYRNRSESSRSKRIQFHLIKEDDPQFFGNREFRISRDGKILSEDCRGYFIRQLKCETPFLDQPLWSFTYELRASLNIDCIAFLPYHHSRAVIRHIVKHSIDCRKTSTEDFIELARFARNQEIQTSRLPRRRRIPWKSASKP